MRFLAFAFSLLVGSSLTSAANPAYVYCIEHDGEIETRADNAGNEFGICMFDDGSECNQWEYLREQCHRGECDHWDVNERKCTKAIE